MGNCLAWKHSIFAMTSRLTNKILGILGLVYKINTWKEQKRNAGPRTTPRRDVELVCICQDFLGVNGPGVTVTVAKADGLFRRIILHDGSLHGLTDALHRAADWIATGANRVDGVKTIT